MITWPAIIKYTDDDELTFIDTFEELNKNPDLRDIKYNPGDILIDATGKVFTPTNTPGHFVALQEPDGQLTLDFIIDLVRKHASICGECCISKISSSTIANAINLVKDIKPK